MNAHKCTDSERARCLTREVTERLHGATPEQLRRAVMILDERTRQDAAQLGHAARASFETLAAGPGPYADRAMQSERLHSATGNGRRALLDAHRAAVGGVRLAFEQARGSACAWCESRAAWLDALKAAGAPRAEAPAVKKQAMRDKADKLAAARRALPVPIARELERVGLLEPGRVFRLQSDIAQARSLKEWARDRAPVYQLCWSRAREAKGKGLDLVRATREALGGGGAAL